MVLPGGGGNRTDERKYESRDGALDPCARFFPECWNLVDVAGAKGGVHRGRSGLRGVTDLGKQLFAAGGVVRGTRHAIGPIGWNDVGRDRRVVRVVRNM